MSQSRPDNVGKNAGPSTCDFAMHYRAKDETLTEMYVNESGNDADSTADAGTEMEGSSEGGGGSTEADLSDAEVKTEKGSVEASGSHSPSPSEYRKMFKNLNEFTEKLTRTVEEKISEIKSDLGSNRSRILGSKENSSVSDSEDNSEGSRLSDLRSGMSDSPKKSPSTAGSSAHAAESDAELPEVENEVRHRRRHWPPEITKLSEEPMGRGVAFDEGMEIEPAVEADESTAVDESDDDLGYHDAKDYHAGGEDGGGKPPKDGEVFNLIRFASEPENKKMEGYAIFITFCVFILPMPSFVRGFLSCLLIVIFWYLLSEYLRALTEPHPNIQTTPFAIPDYAEFEPLKVPEFVREDGVWFNEYTQPYDPDWYSVSQTVPVFLEIENSYLKLSRPKGRISKRATCDERQYRLEFVNQRVYDLRHCSIALRPEGIARRRFFSKKYPIFIELGPDSLVKAVKFKEATSEEESIGVEDTYKVNDAVGGKSSYGREYLNLFARCNRQKEEWFRRLKEAVRYRKAECRKAEEESNGPSTPFENVHFDTEQEEYEEYWQYMTKFVGDVRYDSAILKNYFRRQTKFSRKKKKDHIAYENLPPEIVKKMKSLFSHLSGKGAVSETISDMESTESMEKKPALEVQWLNALINRFLFDIFRTPHWLDKIQAKVQRKLASIRLPYYIEALEVIEMNLGKVGPRFHRISPPYLDERGLWVDTDLTFDGSFKMILQTQLNLLKLQKGLEEEVAKLPAPKQDSPRLIAENAKEKEGGSKHHHRHKVQENKISSKELLMEFAEIAVKDDAVSVKDQGSIATDAEHSDSTESDEDDDDDDEDNYEPASCNMPLDNSEIQPEMRKPTRKSSKKIFRVMESVAQSKYFKTIAETKYVQKALAGVSATKLRLILEVKSCIGTLSINVPPPPNDRIWYGFRSVPKLWMSAQPKVGQKNIRFSHIKHFVEKKIMEEIKKLVVMPNMDDLLIPIPPDDSALTRIVTTVANDPEEKKPC